MPVGEERTVNPISLSDGTLLFMYYRYPLLQAFGGVLAKPKVTLHQGEIYRVRYESRDGEGRDRLEGARPIVTRDWKRSKWLNEYLIGLDELRLMASLGGRGGPEGELYRILSDPEYRDRLACYASKFPDESGGRLIVLNWVGPPADSAPARVSSARVTAGATHAPSVVGESPSRVVIPSTVREPAAPRQPTIERRPDDLSSIVVPLAHQGRREPRESSVETAQRGAAPGEPPGSSGESAPDDAFSRKTGLGMDSTQPVSVQAPAAAAPPGRPPADAGPVVTQGTSVEQIRTTRPTPVVPLAHQGTPAGSTPYGPSDRPSVRPDDRAGSAKASAAPPSIEIEQSGPPFAAGIDILSRQAGGAEPPTGASSAVRRPAATAGRASSMPPLWMIAGVALFGIALMMTGWWLRGASVPQDIARSSHPIDAGRIDSAAATQPQINQQGPAAEVTPSSHGPAGDRNPLDPSADSAAPDGQPSVNPASGGAGTPPRQTREKPEQEVRGNPPPAASPKPQSAAPAPVAIDAPLLAQGKTTSAGTAPGGGQSEPTGGAQNERSAAATSPPVAGEPAARESRRPVEPVPPPPAPGPAAETVPTLKITSAQMSAGQRNYLARVIRFLEPPLRYEWSPKYTRPALFASLVTDGEPPKCRIDFKEPTSITFDLVIKGGSGTESRIENVEVIYR